MIALYKHRGCYGVRLWRCGRTTVALWFVPAAVRLEPHWHPGQEVEIVPLYGADCVFNRCDVARYPAGTQSRPARLFRAFTTPAGWCHFLTERKSAFLYVNKISWLPGMTPGHPAENYRIVQPK